MAKLSRFSKFFVNRSNERNCRRFFHTIRGCLSLDENSSCLELGAGKGLLSYLVYNRFRPRRMVVTDYDPSQVEEAESLFTIKLGTIPANIEFRAADALALPFGNESFDAVFAMMVLHHLEKKDWHFKNIPTALEEIRKALRPGGFFCYTELFSKNRIRNYLSNSCFLEIFATRSYFFFDTCVYRKKLTASVRVHGLTNQPSL
jgi:ubiquinone/menaquinone biosynthesis C-methylase UbiE